MPNRERRKGLDGEREAAAIWRRYGFHTLNLEAGGDHMISREPRIDESARHDWADDLRIHSEVKRAETCRPWAWFEQASSEAPVGAVPVVAFRRSRSPWLALIALDDLARLLA